MIYVTVGSAEEARKIGKSLVSERLAACVNVIDNITSMYNWDGEVQEDSESVLIAKTALDQREKAIGHIADLHSYDTPCVLSYDATGGLSEYLDWLMDEVRPG